MLMDDDGVGDGTGEHQELVGPHQQVAKGVMEMVMGQWDSKGW